MAPQPRPKVGVLFYMGMNYYCYILYSKSLDKYYVGETQELEERLRLHHSGFFSSAYTIKTSDWELFYWIECESRKQARGIERHIKKMKSVAYYQNLKKYPEIISKLKAR
ncbi:MAG: GIY-YIG nuclease family protein [Bacteroidales bacterium]